ncbi:MAG: ABC transporter ATP-binding protein, partial [Candidatus Lokiarchaeota archaeon]|nr:ABC transporter ATP-binding protein [Candidatus Lokiarchaeota archaeon]
MKIKSNDIKDDFVLQLDNVYKTYQLGKSIIHAVNGINLNLKKGEFISIMGPSGSGKTTLLNLISALDKPSKGNVFINGKNTNNMNDKSLTHLRRYEIGFIFQFFNLIPVLTCYENIELPLFISGIGKSERKLRVEELLNKLELSKHRNHRPNELSGGQQQRVAIARALVNKPSIVLADELTGDLDSKTGIKIMKYLQSLNNSEFQTIIIVTHDINIAKMTNSVFEIKDGKFINS